MTITKLLSTTALVCASAAFAAPALAQTPTPAPCPVNDPNCNQPATENAQDKAQNPSSAPGDAPEPDKLDPQSEVEIESGQSATDEDDGEQIIVTGSRIRSPNLNSTVPITSLGQADLLDSGDVNVGDALNDLPSLRSTFSQANSTRFIGTAGLNLLDLRGLGIARTLVLVNGRRHITALPGSFIVDTNTIPNDLLERVDIVTGGSSAVYGSDAVAGVVNFVLKRDFDGVRLRGQAGISSRGDRGIQFVAATAGKNFAEGRGNVAVSVEYANAEPLYFRDRDYLTGAFSGRNQFNLAEPVAGEPAAGDGIPDNLFFRGVRNSTLSNGTLLSANITAAQCAAATTPAAIRAARCLPNGQPRIFTFDQTGNLVDNQFITDFRPIGSANVVGGFGSTLRDTGQLAAGLDRYSANVLAHFDFSEAFKVFAEAKYVRVESLQEGQPSFFQTGTFNFFNANFGFPVPDVRCDNPFLTAQNIQALVSAGRCLGATGLFNPAATLPVARFNVDFGGRGEENRRETYRVVAGIEGDFNDDWHYEASFNYGRLETGLNSLNNLLLADIDGNLDGFSLAIDAVRNASGQIVCRVNADAITTNDRPDCVPLNIFGEGRPSQAALDFVNVTSRRDEKAEQYNALVFLNGDLSQLFELPGGPVRFAIGGEYRRESASSAYDELTASGATFLNGIPPFNPPALEVYEGFGEIELPLLRDLPFAQELTVSGAARYSDYNTGANKTFAYNISGTYAPVSDIRFRANYSRSVRVPTLDDLFSTPGQNFAAISDPCDVNFINNGPNRAANCAALGIPVGFVNTPARSFSTGFLSGGNPDLFEEKGKSLTIGAVLTPRFLPGFSLTVDYYDIQVTDAISVLGAQTIINQCVDSTTINNPFCAVVFRNPDGTFMNPATLSAGINFAKADTEGVDIDLAYRRTFDNGHRLNLRGLATYLLTQNFFFSPTDPEFANRTRSELGDPVFSANFSAAYGIGNFDLRYSLDYIGRQTIGAFETQNSFQGRPPTNADAFARVFYPDVFYHALRGSYKVNDKFRAYAGVDNIFDRDPPLGLLGVGGGDPFDSVGRYFYAGAQIDF